MARLEQRLAALEAKAPCQAPERAPTDYAALRERLMRERLNAIIEQSRAPKPSGVAGIRHYRNGILQTEALAKETPPPNVPGKTNFGDMRIVFAQKEVERGHGSARHELRRCELEVLEAEGFDPARLAQWRQEHQAYAHISWQWRGAELPADALAIVEAAISRFEE